VADWTRLSHPEQIRFEYERLYGGALGQKPLVRINLRNFDPATRRIAGATRVMMLVDSGADITMIPDSFSRVLGVDLTSLPQQQVGGVGGGEACRGPKVLTAELCGLWLPIPVMFYPASRHTPLLGRKGAFEAMHIVFQHASRRMLATLAT
jgi:hypothetical protein